ncbi:acyl carrier protein [uncultured Oscillibacter sp.]|uniref:acyl carrier protein n=1 Tax=uncultured Oscillibacter sp. TaxID=876091 RepID=UPI0025D19D3E|nr:acyl carrier protein [uncultured Oscillibacter sp.]
MSVRETILQLIRQETAIPVPILETTDLFKDLYLDSLSFVSLLLEIEERYHITIELPEMADCRIAGRLVELVERKAGKERNDA